MTVVTEMPSTCIVARMEEPSTRMFSIYRQLLLKNPVWAMTGRNRRMSRSDPQVTLLAFIDLETRAPLELADH